MAKKTKKKSKLSGPARRKMFRHLGLDWQHMKVGIHAYTGSAKGGKANVYRSNLLYGPKKWRSFVKDGAVFIERLV